MAVHRSGQIILNTPKPVYYSGTFVAGCVEFQFENAPVTFSVLQVTLLGEANVKWSEQESIMYNGQKRYRNVDYLGEEEYVNFTQILAGGYDGEIIQLQPGTHKYPFRLQLPPTAPSSFNGKRGRIQYLVKANMSYQGTAIVNELMQFIEVVKPFDLNFGNPKVREPIEFILEDEVCGCFCSSDTVSIKLRLPVSAYCPGQTIPVEVDIDNQSSIEIRKMILQLFKKERYVTQRPQSEFISPDEILVTVNKGAILSKAKRTFTVPLVVPNMVVPNLETCSIIDVGYFFRAIVKLSGCNSDMSDDTEICLGLVPLSETVTEPYIHPMAQSLPDAPIPDPVPIEEIQTNYNNAQQFMQYQEKSINIPVDTSNSNSYRHVQVRQSYYSSADPSKNYNIGFTISGPPGAEVTQFVQPNMQQPPSDLRINLPLSDLRINLPPYPGQDAPSAPPPYLINK